MLVHNPYAPLLAASRSGQRSKTDGEVTPDSPRQPPYSQRRLQVLSGWLDPRCYDDEVELLYIIVGFFRGYGGSIPAERVQNVIRQEHPALWSAVVDDRYHRRWHGFCASHQDCLVLESTTATNSGNEIAWRLRLAHSHQWQAVDRRHEEERRASTPGVLAYLCTLLHSVAGGVVSMNFATTQLNAQLAPDHPFRPLGGQRVLRTRDVRLLLEEVRHKDLLLDRASDSVLLEARGVHNNKHQAASNRL